MTRAHGFVISQMKLNLPIQFDSALLTEKTAIGMLIHFPLIKSKEM